MKNEFRFKAKVEKFSLPASWYFVTVPEKILKEVKSQKPKTIGYGFYPVLVTVGKTVWKTSLLPMGNKTGEKRFFIALKAEVRKKEAIEEGQLKAISFTLAK